ETRRTSPGFQVDRVLRPEGRRRTLPLPPCIAGCAQAANLPTRRTRQAIPGGRSAHPWPGREGERRRAPVGVAAPPPPCATECVFYSSKTTRRCQGARLFREDREPV